VPLNGPVGHRICAQIGQYPKRIELAGRLDDPGDHQVPEHLITDGIKTQAVIYHADRRIQQPRTGRRRPARARRDAFGLGRRSEQRQGVPVGHISDRLGACGHVEPELSLITQGYRTGLLQQNSQLGIGVGRSDMGQDLAATAQFRHHLHRHRSRGGAHLPHVRHRPNLPV